MPRIRWADAFGWDALIVRALGSGDAGRRRLDQRFPHSGGPGSAGVSGARPASPAAGQCFLPGWKTLEAVRALLNGQSGLDMDHPLSKLVTDDMPRFRPKDLDQPRLGRWSAGSLAGTCDKGRYLTLEQAQRLHGVYIGVLESMNERLPMKLSTPASLEASGFVAREFLPDASHIPAVELKRFYDSVAMILADTAKQERADERAARKAK